MNTDLLFVFKNSIDLNPQIPDYLRASCAISHLNYGFYNVLCTVVYIYKTLFTCQMMRIILWQVTAVQDLEAEDRVQKQETAASWEEEGMEP